MLSTYARCRQTETGDPGEGTLTFRSEIVNGDSGDHDLQLVATRSGLTFTNCIDINITNCEKFEEVPDAYLLCFSRSFDENTRKRFGEYCVEISNPSAFHTLLNSRIVELALGLGFFDVRSRLDRVKYRNRSFKSFDPRPDLFFLKPHEFAVEQEHRMVWVLDGNYERLPQRSSVTCYAAAPFLRRIS